MTPSCKAYDTEYQHRQPEFEGTHFLESCLSLYHLLLLRIIIKPRGVVDRYSVARNFQPLGMYSAGRRTSTAPRRGKTAVEAQHSFMQQEGSQRSRAFNSFWVMACFLLRDYNILPTKELHWSLWVNPK